MSALAKSPSSSDSHQVTVLLVDDDKFIRAIVDMALKGTKYKLASVPGVCEALQYINEAPPDILITDAMMPGSTGFDLIKAVKATNFDIPIILLTGLENPDGSIKDSSGMADFRVGKPFKVSQILGVLEAAEARLQVHHQMTEPSILHSGRHKIVQSIS
jgi:two-component system nitrogen regulation response regulator GlnG